MKNIDKIRAMSAEEFVKNVLQRPSCSFCVYNGKTCDMGKDCIRGRIKWLNQETNPMPELKVGDIISIFYPVTNNGVSYVYLGDDVMWCDKDFRFVELKNDMKQYIKAIHRRSIGCFGKVTIWRADNG